MVGNATRVTSGRAATVTSPTDTLANRGARVRLPVLDRVTTDINGYRAAAAGVELDMVRSGPDERPSRMRAARSDFGITLSEARPGCRTISHTHLDANRMATSYVVDAAPGTTWCGELEMAAGMGVIHQPEAEHTAVNVPGTRFVFAILDVDSVVERSDVLEVPLLPWRPGEVDIVDGRAMAATPILTHFVREELESVPARVLDDLITSVVLTLYDPEWDRRVAAPSAVDSRKVVGDCIDFATSIGREPSISEMCLVAHVGGRRLRQAFHEVCAESPKRFFRDWILCKAHDRLLAATFDETSVTRVATDLGLTHLGRFSTQYRELHGESPSETLRRMPAAEPSSR